MTVTNLYNRMLDSGDVEGTRLTEAMNLEEAMKLITLVRAGPSNQASQKL